MQKAKSMRLISILILLGFVTSCKSKYGLKNSYVYRNKVDFDTINETNSKTLENFFTYKSIVILNESVLDYSIHLDHIKTGTTIKYKMENNLLMVDTVDIFNRKKIEGDSDGIFGDNFLFSNDSLVDLRNGNTYYLTNREK